MRKLAFASSLFLLLVQPMVSSRRSDSRVPTDEQALNRFADHYNLYAASLRTGVIDTKQWARVERAWRDMAGE